MNRNDDTLVILTPGFAESEADINCLPMQQSLVRTIKQHHPSLKIVVLSFQYPYFKNEYNWHGINVIPFAGRNKGGFARLLLRRQVLQVLEKINRSGQIIGLLSFWYNECAWVGNKFAGRHGLKHYCWLLGQDAREGNKHVKHIKPEGGELIALSDFIQDEFERNYGIRPLHMIPPGVETIPLNTDRNKRDINILGAGSLIPLKQYNVFIEVIAGLKEQRPDIRAFIAGDGPEREKLQALISTYGLTGNIVLTGELPHDELLRVMQQTTIFIHPSSYEGFGMVCLEALQAGAQVISFCRPMKQSVDQWHIVAGKDEMIQKAKELLTKEEYRQVVPFTIDDTVKKMMALYNK